jgi:hypothetical protein
LVKNSADKITRRNFAGICMGAAVLGAGPEALAQVGGASTANSPTRTGAVDQNPIRRRGTGLRALDVDRASPGLTLFAPANDGIVYLIDLRGTVMHTWKCHIRQAYMVTSRRRERSFTTERSPLKRSWERALSKALLHWRPSGMGYAINYGCPVRGLIFSKLKPLILWPDFAMALSVLEGFGKFAESVGR